MTKPKTYDVMWPKPDPSDPKKTHWVRLGVAWDMNQDGRIKLKIDVLPVHIEGELEMVLFKKDKP